MLLYKFRGLDQLRLVADILLNQRLYCATYRQLNDPFEGFCLVESTLGKPGQFVIKTEVEDLLDPELNLQVRVCSLSASYGDLRLWSHYGGQHRGIAIEIDFAGAEQPPKPVNYIRGLKKYNERLGEHPDIKDILSHKTHHWEHEEEYRIVQTKPHYPVHGRIRRVILGPLVSSFEAALVKRLVLHPDITAVVPSRLNFSLNSVEIDSRKAG